MKEGAGWGPLLLRGRRAGPGQAFLAAGPAPGGAVTMDTLDFVR
jgi:hypothetical protein